MSGRPVEIQIDSLVVPGVSTGDGGRIAAAIAQTLAAATPRQSAAIDHVDLEPIGPAVAPEAAGERIGRELRRGIER